MKDSEIAGTKEYSLTTFLDVKGAFIAELCAILGALARFGIQTTMGNWISKLLCRRTIYPALGCSKATMAIGRETPQGELLSPLLWNQVMNKMDVRQLHIRTTLVW